MNGDGEQAVYNQRRSASASFGGVHKNRKPKSGHAVIGGEKRSGGTDEIRDLPWKSHTLQVHLDTTKCSVLQQKTHINVPR